MAGPHGRYPGTTRPAGRRLTDPRDPAVRDALTRQCPDCDQPPDLWCVGIASNSSTNGRRRSRLHFSRCMFVVDPIAEVKAGVR